MMNAFYSQASALDAGGQGQASAPFSSPQQTPTTGSSSSAAAAAAGGPLQASEIVRAIHSKTIQLRPYRDQALQPHSYDLALGSHAFYREGTEGGKMILFGKNSSRRVWKSNPTPAALIHNLCAPNDEAWLRHDFEEFGTKESGFALEKGESILAYSSEYLALSGGMCAVVVPRSTVSRLRVKVEGAGQMLQSGFAGRVGLIITNETGGKLVIPTGRRIAQLVFFRTLVVQGCENESYPASDASHYSSSSLAVLKDIASLIQVWTPDLLLPPADLGKEIDELPPFYSVDAKGERVVDPETAIKVPDNYRKGKFVGIAAAAATPPAGGVQKVVGGVRRAAPVSTATAPVHTNLKNQPKQELPPDLVPRNVKKETTPLPFVAKYDPNVPPE